MRYATYAADVMPRTYQRYAVLLMRLMLKHKSTYSSFILCRLMRYATYAADVIINDMLKHIILFMPTYAICDLCI